MSQWREDLEPVRRTLHFIDEQAAGAQRLQPGRALAHAQQVLAEFVVETWNLCQLAECAVQFGGQVLQHLMLDIVAQQRVMFLTQRRPRTLAFALGGQQAQGRRPATGQAEQVVRAAGAQRIHVLQPGGNLARGKGQIRTTQLEQLALQQQARQVAQRPPPAAEPPAEVGRRSAEQTIEAGVEFAIGLTRIVIEHDPQRALLLLQRRQQFGFAHARWIAQGDGQLPAELRWRGWPPCTVEPQRRAFGRTLAGAIGEQHRLAEPRRGDQQTQATVLGEQAALQLLALNMPGRLAR